MRQISNNAHFFSWSILGACKIYDHFYLQLGRFIYSQSRCSGEPRTTSRIWMVLTLLGWRLWASGNQKWQWKTSHLYRMAPPQWCLLVYKPWNNPHEYYSYIYHKPGCSYLKFIVGFPSPSPWFPESSYQNHTASSWHIIDVRNLVFSSPNNKLYPVQKQKQIKLQSLSSGFLPYLITWFFSQYNCV